MILGDLVGYGAIPTRPWTPSASSPPGSWCGQPRPGLRHPGSDLGFSLPARTAANWYRGHLTPENAWFLEHIPGGPLEVEGGYYLSPTAAPWTRTPTCSTPGRSSRLSTACDPGLLFGHTHLAEGYAAGAQPLGLASSSS